MKTYVGKSGGVVAIHILRLLTAVVPLIIISSNTLFAEFTGGNGSEQNPYLISSEAELDALRYYPDAHFLQTTDIHLTKTFHPIPLFKGVYDGGGNNIYNLNIKQNKSTNNYEGINYDTGLFATLLEGSFLLNIQLKEGSVTGNNNAGALAGTISSLRQLYGCGFSPFRPGAAITTHIV